MTRGWILVLLTACAVPPGPRRDRPNVLLIITDDQGYGDLGVHGNTQIKTPHLDAFARQSLQIEYFYVSPVCSPTRASLMTGRYNYRTGVVDTYIGRSLMRAEEVTLPEMLSGAGYRTGIFGKWHLGDNYPLRAIDQGFQEALTLKGGGIGQPSDPPGGDSYFDPTLYRNGKSLKTKGYVSDVLTDGAIDFVTRNREANFFCYLAFNAPHGPLEVPDSYAAPYLAMGLKAETAKVYGMVANVDDNLGRLFAKLDELGLARETIVVFMTDNGPQHDRYNAGMRGRKGTVFDGGIRVPCFIRWPGKLAPGNLEGRVAAHIDLAPTLLALCRVQPPGGVRFDGLELFTKWAGERTLFFQWHRGDQPELGRAFAARGPRYKLVGLDPAKPPLLFDMKEDPQEKNDLAGRHPEIVARMRQEYEAWFRDVSSRGYAPARIRLGSEQDNPAVLTRQDWRGAEAGWGPRNRGHWEVEVPHPVTCDVRVLFRALPSPGKAHVKLGSLALEKGVEAGARECSFEAVNLPAGPGRLEPWIESGQETFGADYVLVSRR